jgi:hypothetical protein
MRKLEIASDVFVVLGIGAAVCGIWFIWWPLGLIAGGAALVFLGMVFFKAANAKAAAK